MNAYQLEDGTYVGTQGEAKKSGQEWKAVDVPTNPKEALLEFLNGLKVDVNLPAPYEPRALSEAEQFNMDVREKVLAGNLDLEEAILNAPLEVSVRLGEHVMARIFEHIAKEKKDA